MGSITPLNYNDPSEILTGPEQGVQGARTAAIIRKALLYNQWPSVFKFLGESVSIPPNAGLQLSRKILVPLLSDENIGSAGIDQEGKMIANQNLWGNSTDISIIQRAAPYLGNTATNQNRVGFTEKVHTGSLQRMGMYFTFTIQDIDFSDTEDWFQQRFSRFMTGVEEVDELLTLVDLLNSSGMTIFPGKATKMSEISPDNGTISTKSLFNLYTLLNRLRVPLDSQIQLSSNHWGSVGIRAGRFLFCSPDIEKDLQTIVDVNGEYAYKKSSDYGSHEDRMPNELGTIDNWRMIGYQRMPVYRGCGAVQTKPDGYEASIGADGQMRYDVYPMLYVGPESFQCITYNTTGPVPRMSVRSMIPNTLSALGADVYGDKGSVSVKWSRGVLAQLPERLCRILMLKKI